MVSSSSSSSGTQGTGSDTHPPRSRASFRVMIKSRIKQPQFYWFLGHFFTLYHFIRFHLSLFSVRSQIYHYKMSLFYISITYGIVLYQFYKSGQLKMDTTSLRHKIKTLDNLQYFIMLTALWICSVMTDSIVLNGVTYSPVIYSLFHCLNYFKENLLPFLPINSSLKNLINNNITRFISSYNAQFLAMAQVIEIICSLRSGLIDLPMALFRFLTRFNLTSILKLWSIVIYIWFFKLRYLQNAKIREITAQYIQQLDQLLVTKLPQNILTKWYAYKHIIKSLFMMLPV
ncbi:similar to Saccharomyces cerevisiae YLR064W PER33 Protein that localizes to the endoplasmic reticulum with some nuclear pore complex association [Maudiozyma barnettii]|uniref:Similar to Saccharomyces cerevisiae YLR064W PER33 Protein that localizes to the endoplasmic reticulum with some nuclear pore complex association n=1 Tax=Maudiozyma barnettii TaxID=61262 RepID=A0A8H2VES2_9SACH|nr:Per33p [Kazachstania barnettii]CAB4254140.1 similar to Saccharomyces cerevisiae YLR064W PER33 Protein that localizes to the endoplasmic reticulum with some nuclear pore complex association [Kazachstania barnettii]CAD1781890.1 similar to Saccharomyces cerevisiae YLR064W PER33 Protein that localizes to the endoplasmic reticulum with some nuclear pore complex association [Kazachstania barnettii]